MGPGIQGKWGSVIFFDPNLGRSFCYFFYLFVTEKMSILSVGFCSCFLKKSQGLTGRRMTVLPPDGFGPHGESKASRSSDPPAETYHLYFTSSTAAAGWDGIDGRLMFWSMWLLIRQPATLLAGSICFLPGFQRCKGQPAQHAEIGWQEQNAWFIKWKTLTE